MTDAVAPQALTEVAGASGGASHAAGAQALAEVLLAQQPSINRFAVSPQMLVEVLRGSGGPVRLAMDNVIATAIATQLSVNLISLRWSDDRGHSWGSPVTQDIGEVGEYRTSLQWQRLAYARDRVFEISWSVPMRTALQGCWVDVTPASS